MEKDYWDLVAFDNDKVELKVDEKITQKRTNTFEYKLKNEGKTMGNLLMGTLNDNPKVMFAGYNSTENKLMVRTYKGSKYNPRQALSDAIVLNFEDLDKLEADVHAMTEDMMDVD